MYVLSEQQIRRNRRRLSLLLSGLMLPFLLAWVMVSYGIWLPADSSNNGQLLKHQSSLHLWPWQTEQGFPAALKQHWLLVMITPQNCSPDCGLWQQQLQQVHKALGKEGTRVRRVLLQPDSAQNHLPALPGMGAEEDRRWHDLTLSAQHWQDRPWLQNSGLRVLLVNPSGTPVTGYAEYQSGRDLLQDLRRLLKASSSG